MRISRALAAMAIMILTCTTAQATEITGDELKKALQENPDVLIEAIKANRTAIFDIIKQTGREEQASMQKEAEEAERKASADSFKNPLKPVIDDKTRILGEKDAKYTLVEYSDFQCPYCASAHHTVKELRKRHGKELRFIYKHLPLPFHAQAMPAAQWLEAVAIQSPEKAWKFHDILFENQAKLGVDFFKKTARDLGIDVERCEKDAESQAVKDRIAADMEEARQFGFNGTPGFLLNGIPVKGAYPIEHFEEIIKKLAAAKAN